MSTTKFEHVIGRDGLHRIRKTRVENGEIIGNSHEGFADKGNAQINEALNFSASLHAMRLPVNLVSALSTDYLAFLMEHVPTVDERVFSRPADPFEPQTPGPVEPQLR